MPTETELSQALTTLEEYVNKVGNDIFERDLDVMSAVIDGQEVSLRGHICETEDYFYRIGGHERLESAVVGFHYSIIDNIAVEIPEEHAVEVLDTAGIEIKEGDQQRIAAQYLYQSIEVSKARNLIRHLRLEKPEADTRLTISEDEHGYPTGFIVERMIFPYEDDFGIREFYDSVISVVEVGKVLSEVPSLHLSLRLKEDPRNTRLTIE